MNQNYISISTNDKIGIISNLTTMLSAGISILDAFDALLQGTKGNQKKLLESIRIDLTEGKRLYIAFSKFPKIFDEVTVNLIRAAEEGGTLEITLKDLKKNILKEAEFSDQIKSAIMYPSIVLIVFFLVILVILIFVIPKISEVFIRMHLDLPIPTKILMFLSYYLVHYPIPVVIGVGTVIALALWFYKQNKNTVLNFLFATPLVSTLVKKIDLTRFTRSLSLLLFSGLPITLALGLTENVVLKKEVHEVISTSKEMVLSGKKLSEGFKTYPNVIPNIMVRISEAGERSGTLDRAMQDISEYLEYEVGKELKTVIALLEPIMLVGIGVLIGGIIFSIIVPIYGLLGQIG